MGKRKRKEMNVREMTEEKGEGKGTDLWRGITNFSFISIYCWKKNAEKLNFQHILIFVIFWGCCIHQSPSPIRAKLACTSSLRLPIHIIWISLFCCWEGRKTVNVNVFYMFLFVNFLHSLYFCVGCVFLLFYLYISLVLFCSK